jgi:hypothetical protein
MSVDNPPAFPIAVPLTFQHFETGMTLRDYFAGQVVSVVLSQLWRNLERGMQTVDSSYDIAAKASYEIADAMLAARNQEAMK